MITWIALISAVVSIAVNLFLGIRMLAKQRQIYWRSALNLILPCYYAVFYVFHLEGVLDIAEMSVGWFLPSMPVVFAVLASNSAFLYKGIISEKAHDLTKMRLQKLETDLWNLQSRYG